MVNYMSLMSSLINVSQLVTSENKVQITDFFDLISLYLNI